MSKYQNLWEYFSDCNEHRVELSFKEIEEIAQIPIDHSFLKYKKELEEYGYKVDKISMKNEKVLFVKITK